MPLPEPRTTDWWAKLWVWALVGLALGGGVGVVAARWAPKASSADSAPDNGKVPDQIVLPLARNEAPLVDEFVRAWERYRSVSYVAMSTLQRTTTEGVRLELPNIVVQSGTRRVLNNGLETRDDETSDGTALTTEIARWHGYFDGELPLYRLSLEDGCFKLRLARAIHAPPYGQVARFCFDPETGALAHSIIERVDGTEELRLVWARSEVVEADFDLVLSGEGQNLPQSIQ